MSITKQIFDKNVVLSCFRAFLDCLWIYLASTKSIKSNNIRGAYIRGIYSVKDICAKDVCFVRIIYAWNICIRNVYGIDAIKSLKIYSQLSWISKVRLFSIGFETVVMAS